jgi:SAM-dependent methyltransferase
LHRPGIPLPEFPADESVTGVGLSDWGGYADPLSLKYSYKNTFFHMEPTLNITNPPDTMLGSFDFLISSDIFEHVLQPASKAFAGAFNVLKPGGHLIFSAPSDPEGGAVEHYPQLHAFSVVEVGGEVYVVVRNVDGTCYVDQHPIFHGGAGDVLEMRFFGHRDILDELTRTGFIDIQVFSDPVPAFDLYFEPVGRPILARKPP